MKVFLKFDYTQLTKKLLEDKLSELGYKYQIIGFGEFDFLENIPEDQLAQLTESFANYGIEVVENQKSVLVQKIKDTINEMVQSEEPLSV